MFNTKKFIAEIEKRPSLYNRNLREYSGNGQRNKLWKLWHDVGRAMYENWDNLGINARTKLGKDLHMKWKSIRDHFKKEIALEQKAKEGNGKVKKKYIYYDQLCFLKMYLTNGTSPNTDESSDVKTETTNEREQTIQTENVSTDDKNGSQTKSRERKLPALQLPELSDMVESVPESADHFQKDPMGNKAFLMSLLPLMNTMTQSQIISVRYKIMETFQALSVRSEVDAAQTQCCTSTTSHYTCNTLQGTQHHTHNCVEQQLTPTSNSFPEQRSRSPSSYILEAIKAEIDID